jgi:hypothetical protein
MIINPLSSLQSTMFQPLSNSTAAGNTNSVSSAATLQDSTSDISPMAMFLSNLQQMQQQNPGQFKQITANIADQLQQAAKNAQSQGNSAWANQLNQLASQFQTASTTGQMPAVQSLQQAGMSGHHHHGGHHHSTQASQTDLSSLFQTQNTNTNSQDLASIFTSAMAGSTSQTT